MEEQKGQRPLDSSSQPYSPGVCSEDEIDLVELMRVLARQWKVVCAITVLSILLAVAYVLLARPVYQAQAVVTLPASKDVAALNFNVPAATQFSSTDIFAKFTGNLKSSDLLQQFVAENPQLSSVNQQFVDKSPQSLRDNMPKITEGKKNELGYVFVSLHGPDAKLLADWINGFILLADRRTIGDFCAGIETTITNQKKAIQDQLQQRVDFAVKRRLDRIVQLEDQIAIARDLKIFDRQPSGSAMVASQSVGVTLNAVPEPLYMRGVTELATEKAALEKRKNDEPFIADYRDKQESLALLDVSLKQVQALRATAHAVTVDQPAIEDGKPVKPKRRLVLVLSVVLGGMLGILAAFVVNFIEQNKKA